MKKIGIYLSVGPHAGGSYQYCLSVIEAINEIKNRKIKFVFFILDSKWKKILPNKFEAIKVEKNTFSERIVGLIRKINLPIGLHKLICKLLSKKIRLMNNSNCSYIIFPSQEDECGNIQLNSITIIHDLMHRYEGRFEEYNDLEYKKRELCFKRICKYSNKIIVDSPIGKKHVMESYNCKSNKISVLPFTTPKYLENSKFIDIYKKYKIPKKKFIFYPAQFWEHKNHINLIKAFNIIKKKGININLVLVGKEKNNLVKVKKKIEDYNLKKNIFILGYIDQEDIFTFYKKASMMCFASAAGPTNIPPIEAMSLGCPLVCSNAYGMKKQVGKGGLIFNPDSPSDMANKIYQCFKNKKSNKILIKNGFKQYSKFNNKNFNIRLKKIIFA
tara:strand:+ start:3830 stop:4987 length:1158 start_codon:yes stop_codon:yes gene_type:complete